jgi:hypothetical protein
MGFYESFSAAVAVELASVPVSGVANSRTPILIIPCLVCCAVVYNRSNFTNNKV